jgi:DNA-binding MarR family transcriptional regulator
MQNSPPNRNTLIRMILDTMDTSKRGMHAHLQSINRTLPLPRAQWELLATIRHIQPISSKELAKQLYLTPGAVSQLLEGLEQQELISRTIDPKDRRIQCLEVTKKGLKLIQTVEKKRREFMERVFTELDNNELEVLLSLQQKLIAYFQREMNAETK